MYSLCTQTTGRAIYAIVVSDELDLGEEGLGELYASLVATERPVATGFPWSHAICRKKIASVASIRRKNVDITNNVFIETIFFVV